jgi:hypothetical protein
MRFQDLTVVLMKSYNGSKKISCYITNDNGTSQVLTAVLLKIPVPWDVMLCQVLNSCFDYRVSRRRYDPLKCQKLLIQWLASQGICRSNQCQQLLTLYYHN